MNAGNSYESNGDVRSSKILKHFNSEDFKKSLIPHPGTLEYDYDETPHYEEFLDNVDEEIPTKSPKYNEMIRNIENLRTWSKIVFKKIPVQDNFEKPEVTMHNENLQIDNEIQETPSDDYREKYLPCKEHKMDIESVINSFLHEEQTFRSSGYDYETYCDLAYIPLIKSEKRKFFRFFYLDAYAGLFGDQSVAFLFGKTYCPKNGRYRSCSVVVSPLTYKIFVLPRNSFLCENSDEDIRVKQNSILKEFYHVALKPLLIEKFSYRFVLKKNFDNQFGAEEQMFMEVEYSAKCPQLNQDFEGRTFSAVYGRKSKCFENFLLEKSIKGPCWIDVLNPKITHNPKTWCSFEILCTPRDISVTDPSLCLHTPPLTMFSMCVRNVRSPNEESEQIGLISWAVNDNYDIRSSSNSHFGRSYCAFVSPSDQRQMGVFDNFKRTLVKEMNSEIDLLEYFLGEFFKIDPDILVGYDFENHERHKFISRLVSFKIEGLSKLGRFRGDLQHRDVKHFLFSGRLICDIKKLKESMISTKKQELSTLYENFLDISSETRYSKCTDNYASAKKLLEFVVFTTNEAINLLKLAIATYIIPLSIKVTNVCGNILSQTLSTGVLKRCEFLLLHAFHENGFVLPEKHYKQQSLNEEKLIGGSVLQPKIGFYDDFVLLMDFQSLYPSIIHEYNLCISHSDHERAKSLGVLPSLMHQLIEKRSTIKNIMKNLDENSNSYFRFKIYQAALKLSANGIFGCLANPLFRFYYPSLAHQITSKGREILYNSVLILRNKGFEVIYGDTDSMMINTNTKNLTDLQNLGKQIKEIVNKQYSSIQLNVDSIFTRLLVISKKKYVGISVRFLETERLKYETILKGLDIVRNDWSPYACQMGRLVVDYILSDLPSSSKILRIKQLLHQIKEDLLHHRVPKQSLVITKFLSQEPEDYLTSYPHVEVALRCNKKTLCHFRKGDAVSYVICCDGTNRSLPKRAYHLKELEDNPELTIDVAYYLHKQVFPIISRMCTPFGNLDSEIEETLGLKNIAVENVLGITQGIQFQHRDPFTFVCSECGTRNFIHKIHNSNRNFPLLKCQNADCISYPLKKPNYLRNHLMLAMRRYIKKYYRYEYECNKKCGYTSYRLPLNSAEGRRICPFCGRGEMQASFSEIDLFLQLEYFRSLFDQLPGIPSEQWIKDAYADLILLLDNYKQYSNFRIVNLTDLFSNL